MRFCVKPPFSWKLKAASQLACQVCLFLIHYWIHYPFVMLSIQKTPHLTLTLKLNFPCVGSHSESIEIMRSSGHNDPITWPEKLQVSVMS